MSTGREKLGLFIVQSFCFLDHCHFWSDIRSYFIENVCVMNRYLFWDGKTVGEWKTPGGGEVGNQRLC